MSEIFMSDSTNFYMILLDILTLLRKKVLAYMSQVGIGFVFNFRFMIKYC